MTTKRAKTRFRVAEQASGQPILVLEPLSGDDLQLFQKSIGFDLPPATSIEDAQELARLLNSKLVYIAEW
jgi:hypothetical protein